MNPSRITADSWFVRGPVIVAILAAVALAANAMIRRNVVIRREPLANPIAVTAVGSDLSLTLADTTTVRLAGIVPPQAPEQLDAALAFLNVAVAQGIEIDQRLPDGSVIARGELRVFNTCGTGNIRAWYHQIELNSWLIASSCGSYSPSNDPPGSTRDSLNIAHKAAEELRLSSASGCPCSQLELEPDLGLSVRDYGAIRTAITVARIDAGLDPSLP